MRTPPGTERLGAELERLEAAQLYRRRRIAERDAGLGPVELRIDGRACVAFSSNDYLGLAHDPRLARVLADAALAHGTGSGAAHLVTGHGHEHQALEEALAEFTGQPRALLFSTGYMANLGLVCALAGRGDRVVEDRLNHASLLDASRLSGAKVRRYAHADAAAAAARLEGGGGQAFIVTDGVFSMDGDLAPLRELAGVARAAGAGLLVDDAHGFGVLGREGRGSVDEAGLAPQDVTAVVGTFGKALGTFGAFVAGSQAVIETLIQRARPYVYTTAAPPALAAATRAALAIARAEPWRRSRLETLVGHFRAGAAQLGLRLMDSRTPIQPVLAGGATDALAAAAALYERGLWVTPIRPPTVPEGSARLRITFSAAHEEAHVDRLLEALADLPMLRREGAA